MYKSLWVSVINVAAAMGPQAGCQHRELTGRPPCGGRKPSYNSDVKSLSTEWFCEKTLMPDDLKKMFWLFSKGKVKQIGTVL